MQGGTAPSAWPDWESRLLLLKGWPRRATYLHLHVDNKGVTIQEDKELVGQGELWN